MFLPFGWLCDRTGQAVLRVFMSVSICLSSVQPQESVAGTTVFFLRTWGKCPISSAALTLGGEIFI